MTATRSATSRRPQLRRGRVLGHRLSVDGVPRAPGQSPARCLRRIDHICDARSSSSAAGHGSAGGPQLGAQGARGAARQLGVGRRGVPPARGPRPRPRRRPPRPTPAPAPPRGRRRSARRTAPWPPPPRAARCGPAARRARPRVQPDRQEAGHDLGVAGHHPQVGGEGQVHARAHRAAPDRRDRGRLELAHPREGAVHVAEARRRPPGSAGSRPAAASVSRSPPAQKKPPAPRTTTAPTVGVGVHLVAGLHQLAGHVAREGVAARRGVEGDRGHAAVALDGDLAGHGADATGRRRRGRVRPDGLPRQPRRHSRVPVRRPARRASPAPARFCSRSSPSA